MKQTRRDFAVQTAALSALAACKAPQDTAADTVNDITGLNPIHVARIARPSAVEDISSLVSNHGGPISIGGGRFSQGGQTACDNSLFVDMRRLNRILSIDQGAQTITLQTGATWRQVQEAVDPLNLSPKIMQSFSNFTIGGSLSVNCHGDYVGLGPLIESVRAIRVVMANGEIKSASRSENSDLFSAAIGGYGGIGIIAEATLDLARNTLLERITHRMKAEDYPAWRQVHVSGNSNAVLHHGVLYPPKLEHVAAEVSSLTSKPATLEDRLAPLGTPDAFQRALLDLVVYTPPGPAIHEQIYDPLTAGRPAVFWRNYIAARDVFGLEPASRARSTYALQEYFVPIARYDAFITNMRRIFAEHQPNVINVAIRHSPPDEQTLLAWAKTEVFAFVLYYQQEVTPEAQNAVGVWTRALIEAAVAEGGSYYLPYQIHASRGQFLAAYPKAGAYFAAKRRFDPANKFRNRLIDTYQ